MNVDTTGTLWSHWSSADLYGVDETTAAEQHPRYANFGGLHPFNLDEWVRAIEQRGHAIVVVERGRVREGIRHHDPAVMCESRGAFGDHAGWVENVNWPRDTPDADDRRREDLVARWHTAIWKRIAQQPLRGPDPFGSTAEWSSR